MAQILPHLLAMIHPAPDATVHTPGSPASILKWVLWGCFAASVGALLVTASRIALGPSSGPSNPKLFWTLIVFLVAGSSFAIAGGLS
jgi:hypothetical protein